MTLITRVVRPSLADRPTVPVRLAQKLVGVSSRASAIEPGSGTGRAERRRVRPAEAAFRAHLYYALLTCDNSVRTGGNQQISPCFLQDLQSEVDYQQTEGVINV